MTDWLRVLDGSQFGLWLRAVASDDRVSQGVKLDPFATSARDSHAWAGWLRSIREGEPLPPRGGGGQQHVTDLIGAGVLVRDVTGAAALTTLGRSVLEEWEGLGIDDDTPLNEFPRCLVLAELGLREGTLLYRRAYAFWRELRTVYDAEALLQAPEQLYLASYLNQTAAGINPWDLIRTVGPSDSLSPLGWDSMNAASLSADSLSALARLRERVTGFASRPAGRRRFCQAMETLELYSEAPSEALAWIERWVR
jgi:hypothetical protein